MKQIWLVIERVLALLAIIGLFIQTGRILERLDHVEDIAVEAEQTRVYSPRVTHDQYMELRDIHVREGDL